MGIAQNIERINALLPQSVTLVAVSKTKPDEDILEAYGAGQRIFGENKVQEMCAKYERLPKDIEWHMIGHLQSNKIKFIVPFVRMIHSVDSPDLLRKINAAAEKAGRRIDCLLEVHIAREETKFGFSGEEALEMALGDEVKNMEWVRVKGLMGMASNTPDMEWVREEFKTLKGYSDRLKSRAPEMDVLSMGMSGDYPVAVECGSTMVRVGSGIFGIRNYQAEG